MSNIDPNTGDWIGTAPTDGWEQAVPAIDAENFTELEVFAADTDFLGSYVRFDFNIPAEEDYGNRRRVPELFEDAIPASTGLIHPYITRAALRAGLPVENIAGSQAVIGSELSAPVGDEFETIPTVDLKPLIDAGTIPDLGPTITTTQKDTYYLSSELYRMQPAIEYSIDNDVLMEAGYFDAEAIPLAAGSSILEVKYLPEHEDPKVLANVSGLEQRPTSGFIYPRKRPK